MTSATMRQARGASRGEGYRMIGKQTAPGKPLGPAIPRVIPALHSHPLI
jgi:hypothetical protein